MKISYLGPEGSFTNQALLKYLELHEIKANLIALENIKDVRNSLKDDVVDMAMMAMYNSREGHVQKNFDYIYKNNFYINGEIRLPIELVLATSKDHEKIEEVYSHEKALAQCEEAIGDLEKEQGTKIKEKETTSTSAALENIVNTGNKKAAAICSSKLAAKNTDVVELGKVHAATDFYIVSKESRMPEYSENKNYKTVAAITPYEDRPRLLGDICTLIGMHRINMTDLFPRPLKVDLKDSESPKMFYITMQCHINEERFQKAFDGIQFLLNNKESNETYRMLGCFEAHK